MPSSFRRHKSDSAFFNPFFLPCFHNESSKLSDTNSLNMIYRAWHSQVLGRYEETRGHKEVTGIQYVGVIVHEKSAPFFPPAVLV